ncbi:MAG: hypothetical protein EPN82_10380 [Bacteroidetes bacterium]|nr:MAG: hypothetical protein EPN82_10380 [Bacteroidota bacterium]
MKFFGLGLLLFLLNCISVFSIQKIDNSTKANELYLSAIQSINNGKYDDAIDKCDSAMLLNPEPIAYPYEKALALYKKDNFEEAVKILDSLTNHKEVNPQIYQLLGNSYDAMNNGEKSLEIYKNGLAKFPKSGRLYYEIGINYISQKDIRKALSSWENGIFIDPQFANNYLILSKYYFQSGFSCWAVIYGEIFINLTESNLKSKEMSHLLFDFFKKSFYFQKDSMHTIQFTTSMITSTVKRPNKDLPFDMAYQSVMQEAAKDILPADTSQFSIDVLYQIRKKFIELWYAENLDVTFPNVLLDWHKKLIEQGIFEVYNYFLFNEAAVEETKSWIGRNQLKVKRFQEEIQNNLLLIDDKHLLYRHQY